MAVIVGEREVIAVYQTIQWGTSEHSKWTGKAVAKHTQCWWTQDKGEKWPSELSIQESCTTDSNGREKTLFSSSCG